MIDRDTLTCIGYVAQPHALRGGVRLSLLTATPEFYRKARRVFLEMAEGLREFKVRSFQPISGHWVLALEGIEDRTAAGHLKHLAVLLEEAELKPLESGEFFQHDLVGCEVLTAGGEPLGQVREVMETGANDVLVVGQGETEVMVPLVKAIVREVDIAGRRILIDPPPGLLGEEDQP